MKDFREQYQPAISQEHLPQTTESLPLEPVVIQRSAWIFEDLLHTRDTPAFIQKPTGKLALGNVAHLPDTQDIAASAAAVDWNKHLPGSSDLVRLPEDQNIILRRHSNMPWETPEDLACAAEQGIRHLEYIADNGIAVRPHRFAVVPNEEGKHQLVSVTEALEGDTLDDRLSVRPPARTDIQRVQAVVDGLAAYHCWAIDNEECLLYDKAALRQYTITPENEMVLHDTGLEMQKIDFRRRLASFVGHSITSIFNLAEFADNYESAALRQLQNARRKFQ
jgi:hypothetical protein